MAGMNHGGSININSAILSQLDKIEAKLGVPALSNRIQASRPYGSTEELVTKKVLSQTQFDEIKDMVTIADVVLTGEARDIDYFLKLGLMQGHLGIARELLVLRQPSQALPHIGHPVEEIYVDVEDQLDERKVPEFKSKLIALQDLIRAKPNDPQVLVQLDQATTAINQALQALPAAQRQSPSFILKVITGLLDAAATEYRAAISGGKISAAIEYQDSRGFVRYASQLYQGIAPRITQENPALAQALEARLTALAKAWPSALAPTTPVLTPDAVAQAVKDLELSLPKQPA
jgi:hypothetical protein